MTAIAKTGELFDQAAWGQLKYWTGTDRLTIEEHPVELSGGLIVPADTPDQGGKTFGIEWEIPRTFDTVVIEYDGPAPDPKTVKLQYWQHTWPADWRGGWTSTDDPYNGKWVTAHDNVKIDGAKWIHTFDPLDFNEVPKAVDHAVFHRQALKLRFLYKGAEAPRVKSIHVYGKRKWLEADLVIELGHECAKSAVYSGDISIYNGCLADKNDSDAKRIRAKFLYADTVIPDIPSGALQNDPDATIATIHCQGRGFSFLVAEAVKGPIYIPDLGVLVKRADEKIGVKELESHLAGRECIYDRIAQQPEQSYEQASREIPQLVPKLQNRYVILGCDSNRQELALRWNGDIWSDKKEMKMKKRDAAKLLWPGRRLEFRFPTGDPIDFRERDGFNKQSAMDGFLPIYTTRWLDREFEFTQTAFASYIFESPCHEAKKRGDEPIVAFAKFEIRNTTEETRCARLWCVVGGEPEVLSYENGFVFATARLRQEHVPNPVESVEARWVKSDYEQKRLRAQFETFGKGEARPAACTFAPNNISSYPNAIVYEIELGPGEEHTVLFKLPFITFTGTDGKDALRALDFDSKLLEMHSYWHSRINEGAKIDLPDLDLTDFNRANVPHVLITGDKDVDTGHYMLGAGTWAYDVFGTETIDQVRALDLRGYHAMARQYLMPWLDLQGTRRMDGRFKTQEWAIHGLRVDEDYDYQCGDYSHDHGTVLWWIAEHYLLTRDKAWLASIADKLVKACDYITLERQQSMKSATGGASYTKDGKVWQYGLMPECHLDDNPEWLFWFIISTLCYRAMVKTAQALSEIDHPEAKRIAKEAEEFGEDIKRSIDVSIERAPVVKLRDGTYVPFVPVRARLRGRDVGWIRDALYGPIHFIDCGLIDPDSDLATWIFKDYEDNVFATRLWGRQIDMDNLWFSQGGITIQSNLLPNPIVYVERDQPEHAIRAFYNSFAANFYRDVRCFTEHPIDTYGIGRGPFYKTPDECAFLTWMRYLLLREQGDKLVLAPSTPRAWLENGREIVCDRMATYFGPVSFKLHSHAGDGKILASVAPSPLAGARPELPELVEGRREGWGEGGHPKPASIDLRLRHPEGKTIKSVTVNGAPHKGFSGESVILTDLGGAIEVVATY